jgi:dynein heavy chain
LVAVILILALEEANDINTYLKALRPQIEKMQSINEFVELAQIFPGLMKTILLIWKSSMHYNTPNRLTVIIQEICNDIVEAARTYICPAEIFTTEPEEAAEKLRSVLRVCNAFKSTYFEYKQMTVDTIRPWNFDTKLVFKRLDEVLLRVEKILGLFEIIIEFNRLEKIEIGGTKGKILSSQVAQIFNEFTIGLTAFAKLKYDILNIALKQFDEDRNNFTALITDLDRRISTILCQAFDDCSGLYSCFRLIESFGGLLNRHHIRKDFQPKYFELLRIYTKDLDDVSLIFLRGKDAPPIHYNMAPVTGTVAWIHELKDRIAKAMDKLKSVSFL